VPVRLAVGKKLWLGLVLALVATIGAVIWQYRAQVMELATLRVNYVHAQQALERTRQALAEAERERAHLETVLAEREAARSQAQARAERLRQQIEELRRADADVDEWAGQRVPAALLERLRDGAGRGD